MSHPHVSHFEDAPKAELRLGHLDSLWSDLGEAVGTDAIGASRIQVSAGGWSTPAHEHGAEEELFYVLAGRGIAWTGGRTCEIRAGDCILYRPLRGAHTLYAVEDLGVIAFGPRIRSESLQFPRLGYSKIGGRLVESEPGAVDGMPAQFLREMEAGPPELPETPGPRHRTVVNLDDVAPVELVRPRIARTRRDLGTAVGSQTTGIKHLVAAPGKLVAPLHCHSAEDELFVVLDGEGTLLLGEDEIPLRPGSVVGRPAGTGVAHTFRGGDGPLTLLAYGTREPHDMCFYPTSKKVLISGIGVAFSVEPVDYFDGED